jgi:hypothetical protein
MRLQRYVSAFINFYVKNAHILDMMIAVNQKQARLVSAVLKHNRGKAILKTPRGGNAHEYGTR